MSSVMAGAHLQRLER